MRVLVTGALGYVGLAVLRGLRDHAVVGVGRPSRNAAARAVIPPSVSVIEGDVLNQAPRLFGEHGPFDAVIHLAGGGGPRKCEADPPAAIRDNVDATLALIDAAKRAGVGRLLFASTIQVYGTHRPPAGPYRESDDAAPDDLYGAVKHAAERAWTAPSLGGGTALRLANVYGAGAGIDVGVAGAVERFARAAATGGEVTIFGTGSQRIDYVHVDDVVRAFEAALAAPAPPPVVNIGGGAPVSIATLAETCARIGAARGTPPRVVRKDDPGGKIWPDRSLDTTLASRALGWAPTVPLETGLGELVSMMTAG